MRIPNNGLTSRLELESQGIVTAVEHMGTSCINNTYETGDGASAIPVPYSPSFLAQIYVAVDTRPCSLDLSRDDCWTMNPSYHTTRKDPNRKKHDPAHRNARDPAQESSRKKRVDFNSNLPKTFCKRMTNVAREVRGNRICWRNRVLLAKRVLLVVRGLLAKRAFAGRAGFAGQTGSCWPNGIAGQIIKLACDSEWPN